MTSRLVKLIKVYDKAPHNAFTDIALFKGYYYIVFRGGSAHSSYDGRIIVVRSKDLTTWEEVARLSTRYDDRDPHLLVFENRLFVYFACRSPEPPYQHTRVCWSEDGSNFSEAIKVYEDWYRLWRPKVHGKSIYCAAYDVRGNLKSCLLRSENAIHWSHVSTIYEGDRANETEIVFLDGEILALVRREGGERTAAICRSQPPYTSWKKWELNEVLQGQAMFPFNGRILVASRVYIHGKAKTCLQILEPETLSLKPVLILPSGGDTSYPGILLLDHNKFAISYYSSHEGKSSIYLAMVVIHA